MKSSLIKSQRTQQILHRFCVIRSDEHNHLTSKELKSYHLNLITRIFLLAEETDSFHEWSISTLGLWRLNAIMSPNALPRILSALPQCKLEFQACSSSKSISVKCEGPCPCLPGQEVIKPHAEKNGELFPVC